jgi:D-alanyl-lipoteichoic acid acyltransferase DltB (MBOAT superfamily)
VSFTSIIFLLFLPLVFCIHWLLPRRTLRNSWLVAASYFFYGYWDYRFCLLMFISSMVDFSIGLALHRSDGPGRRKTLLVISLLSNLGLLGIFKYLGFFVESFRELATVFGFDAASGTWEIILPVGISFYTFQTLSYTIDIYREKLQPTRSLADYLAFVSFFPQLVAGPIERASRLLPQFQADRKCRWQNLSEGIPRILWGFFKKIVIADSLAVVVQASYGDPLLASGPELMLATFFFAFQIYADFSAYSDIAIGTARLFDIRLMQNFAYPYFSQSIWEFWQRWHISLSTWFRDYLYIPLGGNRDSRRKRNQNILITFLVSGLWHGAAWRFIAWGGLHGTATIGLRPGRENRAQLDIEQPGGRSLFPSASIALRIIGTFCLVSLFWVFFRASSMADSILIFKKMAVESTSLVGYRELVTSYLGGGPIFTALNLVLALVVLEWCQRHLHHPLQVADWPKPLRWAAYTATFWFVVEYAGRLPDNPFIYFQF